MVDISVVCIIIVYVSNLNRRVKMLELTTTINHTTTTTRILSEKEARVWAKEKGMTYTSLFGWCKSAIQVLNGQYIQYSWKVL